MPIINRQDAAEVEQDVARFFAVAGAGRVQALRRLFVEKLDFNSAAGSVSLANAPKNVALPPSAERIASMEGLHVVYVPLSGDGPNRVRKAEASVSAKLIADVMHGDLLLVMTNPSCSQLHVIYPTFAGAAPSLRRMIIERDLPRRTAVQQLSNIYWQWKDTGSIRIAVDRAFDVDAVTKDFFTKYKSVFEGVMAAVKEGFGPGEEEAKKLFVQTLFNRLMFIYFLSRKGWLKFKGDPDYLNALRKDYPAWPGEKNFYDMRLKLLFFTGLNNPDSRDLHRGVAPLIGDVPFLNGGLFDQTDEDKRPNILVPDAAIDQILHGLFDRFNFTVMESTPFDVEVAVDPEMLGKVFEELVTGRHESGSYYTPRPVVSFMCREALKGYLETQDTGASTEAIAAFVDHKDTSKLTLPSAPKVGEALARVKVVDPACGSGAYLLGMMQELVELMAALYSDHLSHQALDLYNLKLGIIQQNLYGADIDQFAVNIAMLRLWLSLAIEYDGKVPPPLPNLDFKIVKGDSLLGPDPSPENYGTLFRHRIHQLAGQLADLKARHMRATGQEKTNLTRDIERLKAQLREALADAAAPEGVVDWRVEFAEVFGQNGGFDVAIANPPYVNMVEMDSRNSTYRTILRALFTSAKGGFDLYIPFMERGLQMLKTKGMFAFIVPNKVLSSEYAREIRSLFVKAAPPMTLVDMSSVHVFEASVYPVVIVAAKASPDVSRHTLGAWRASGDSAERVSIEFIGTAPLSLVAAKGETWSPLLVSSPKAVFLTHSKRFPALVTMASVHGACTVSEAYEWKDAIRNDGKDLAKNPKRYAPFIVSGNIRPFRHTWDTERVRYIKDTYSHPVIDKNHRAISSTRRLQIESAKVIISGMSKRPTSVWDRGGIAAGKSTVIVIPNNGLDGRYLTCVINSEVMHELYVSLFGSLSLAGGYLRFGPPQIRELPIGIPSDGILARICNLADELAKLMNNPVRDNAEVAITEEINKLVRDIYA